MSRPILVIILASLFTLGSANAADKPPGKLYRWVDEEGNVHYSDKLPPEQAQKSRDEISDRGVHLGTVPPAKTPEEYAREQEEARLRAEHQRILEAQQAADKVLLRTFRTEDDLLLARDGKLASIDIMIKVTQGNIRRAQTKLTDLQARAATAERSGRAAPAQVMADIQATQRAIEEGYATIVRREGEKDAIRAASERDLKRFRELKNLNLDKEIPGQHTLELSNIIVCEGTGCAAAWTRAEAFVRRHATTPLQIQGDNILMTGTPAEEGGVGIAVSRIQDKIAKRTVLFLDLYCRPTLAGQEFCASEKVTHIRRAFRQDVGQE